MNLIVKIIFSIVSAVVLISCESIYGNIGSSQDKKLNPSVFITAGAPINASTCKLYMIINGVKAVPALQTASSIVGDVEFDNIDYIGSAVIECVDGNYNDPATDVNKNIPIMHSVVNFSSEQSFVVSPLTEIAYKMDKNLENVLITHNKTVAKAFGMKGIDITTTMPTNGNIEDNNSGYYTSVLIALSQLEKNSDQGSSLLEMTSSLKDGLFDNGGKLYRKIVDDILKALEELKTTNANIGKSINKKVIDIVKYEIYAANITFALNDTGSIYGTVDSDQTMPTNGNPGISANCSGDFNSGHDCTTGRDAKFLTGRLFKFGGGNAGFDFTKLDFNGRALTIQNKAWKTDGSGNENAGTKWSCVRDNITGYIWEVKTDQGSPDVATRIHPENFTSVRIYTANNIHHTKNHYRWGGKTADVPKVKEVPQDTYYYTDWNQLLDGSNNEKLCGFDDWIVPSMSQLFSIANYGKNTDSVSEHRYIDIHYFPNTEEEYWSANSASIVFANNSFTMVMNKQQQFSYQNNSSDGSSSSTPVYVRLMRFDK